MTTLESLLVYELEQENNRLEACEVAATAHQVLLSTQRQMLRLQAENDDLRQRLLEAERTICRLQQLLAQYSTASNNWRQMFDHGSDPLIVWCGQGPGPQVADEALKGA